MDIYKSWLVKKFIAHRGFHNNFDAPENTLKAFENAIKKDYVIELDVRIIKDGTIVVFHDDELKRLTGKNGKADELTKEDLKEIKILSSNQHIPTFEEVLKLVNGQVPLLIEIKNYKKDGILEKELINILKDYKGEFAVQSFNPFSLEYFKKYYPSVLRGQLSSYFKNEKNLSFVTKFVLKRMLLNKSKSNPHFVSYDVQNMPNKYTKKLSIPVLVWTVKNQKQYENVSKYCDNIIFEGFEPEL